MHFLPQFTPRAWTFKFLAKKHIPIVAPIPTFPGTFQHQFYDSPFIALLPPLTRYPPSRPRPGRQGWDTRPTLATGSTGQVRVAGTVASECTGVGGGWRDPPSGKRREEKDTSGLGRREKGRRSRQRRLFSGGLHLSGLLPPNIWY